MSEILWRWLAVVALANAASLLSASAAVDAVLFFGCLFSTIDAEPAAAVWVVVLALLLEVVPAWSIWPFTAEDAAPAEADDVAPRVFAAVFKLAAEDVRGLMVPCEFFRELF